MPDPKEKPGGKPLPPDLRQKMESAFGADLSSVRIHENSNDAVGKVGARAFTVGNDIFFSSGAYRPSSPDGKRLLAHEVAHALQQRKGVSAGPEDPAAERQARKAAEKALGKF